MSPSLAILKSAVNVAVSASNSFDQAIQIAPIGRLHLERLEMTPAGIERGELLATIPLAPQETTGVIQKEWATTSDEFSSIVTDYLEQVSEKGVTEKTELAQSSDVQTKHDNSLDLSASVSGSYGGFVSFSANSSAKLSDSLSDSEKVSRNHAIETTRKASTRSKKERQVTIQQVSTTGSEQVTTRTLTNPSTTNALRIDYYSMMRKWLVRLYRYGLRMTYDIAIPEPGAALREPLAALEILNSQVSQVFVFSLDPNSITPSNWQALQTQYGVALNPPPDATKLLTPSAQLQNSQDKAVAQSLDFSVPDGYAIDHVLIGGWASPADSSAPEVSVAFAVSEQIQMFTDGQDSKGNNIKPGIQMPLLQSGTRLPYPEIDSLQGSTGSVSIQFLQGFASAGSLDAYVYANVLPATMATWQQQCWQAVQQAQSNAFYLAQQALAAQRDALQTQIGGVDTLTLRQEEMEEVMKGVLKWLLGPSFDFMPTDVQDLFSSTGLDQLKSYVNLTSDQLNQYSSIIGGGISFTGSEMTVNGQPMDPSSWAAMFRYQEMVKFIQQAIEWENLLYFLYPYFWDIPSAWDFVRNLEHPDLTRQQFVRAGSARVVITIRPGFEQAFASFIEQGDFGQTVLSQDHPYMTIAEETQAYNDTNYPGIPPANPDAIPVDPQNAASTACSSKVSASSSPVALTVDTTDGFQVGMTVSIDDYDSDANIQEAQTITAIPDAKTIQVSQLKYAHDGSTTPFPIVQPGEAGVVIAEWYEYTPSHGTDIGLATPLPEMD